LAIPQPVKLSTQFATDLDEAERATLSKCKLQTEETTIGRPFADKRTLSNASNASSNATTLVDKEDDLEGVSPTQSRPFCKDGIDTESYPLKIVELIDFWQVVRKKVLSLGGKNWFRRLDSQRRSLERRMKHL
jgi:hypothetical protein